MHAATQLPEKWSWYKLMLMNVLRFFGALVIGLEAILVLYLEKHELFTPEDGGWALTKAGLLIALSLGMLNVSVFRFEEERFAGTCVGWATVVAGSFSPFALHALFAAL